MARGNVQFDGIETYAAMTPGRLRHRLEKAELLEATGVDFIPLTPEGRTLRTTPNISNEPFAYRINKATQIITKNPLCYIATKAIQDEVTSADLIVQEKQGNTWVKHEDNDLEVLIESPNADLTKDDLLRAWVTHLPNFGYTQLQVFGENDILPTGKQNKQPVALDIPYPTQLMRDLRTANGNYFYRPYFSNDIKIVSNERVFTDKNYHPKNPFGGIAVATDVLDRIFQIDTFYTRQMSDFFEDGGMPRGLLTRKIDITKEPNDSYKITQKEVEEQVQNMYAQVNTRYIRRNIAGLKGDWDWQTLSAGLDNLLQKDLAHFLEVLVAGTYGVPASLYWVGLELSNQRASREQDAIGFYARTIHNLMTRIAQKLNNSVVPLLGFGGKFRFFFDVSQMPLSQVLRLPNNREKERWFQTQIINRGMAWDLLGLPVDQLSDKEKKEMYQGNKGAGASLNNGAGNQSQVDQVSQ